MKNRTVGLALLTLALAGLLANSADYLLGLSLIGPWMILVFLALVLAGMSLARKP